MSYTITRSFSAPAEVVFGTATDLNRWGRWLPPGVTVEAAGQDELRVTWSGRAYRIRWTTAPERLEATARALQLPLSAAMRVHDGPAGSSNVELRLDGDGQMLRQAAERALNHLEAEVSDNFNAG